MMEKPTRSLWEFLNGKEETITVKITKEMAKELCGWSERHKRDGFQKGWGESWTAFSGFHHALSILDLDEFALREFSGMEESNWEPPLL